ncbi:chemotaxis protein [Geomonas sp. Red276]
MGWFGSNQDQVAKEKSDEIAKLCQMLDNVDNIVMLCDPSPQNNIIYMNRRAKELMAQHRRELNAALGGADVANASGNSIHQFHKAPERIRSILGDPTGKMPDKAEIPIGTLTLRTTTYPIWDATNPSRVLCYMACWSDVTAEKELERRRVQDLERKEYLENRVTQIATAMEEMSATVNEVARNTVNASETTTEMATSAREGQDVVNQAVGMMQKVAEAVRASATIMESLGSKSQKISEFVTVIDDIADQTNLLALNAAIEAARAGEQGRGFAVVADEVRTLADRTVNSTKEIRLMVKEIQQETDRAVSSIERGKSEAETGESLSSQAANSLQQMVHAIDQVANMIAQIATASEEQAATSTTIAGSLEEIVQRG